MTILKNFIQNKRPEDPLLYGLKGKPLENKQMNYITDKVCEHLGWIKVEYENPPIIDNRSKKKKNQKKVKKSLLRQRNSLLLTDLDILLRLCFMKSVYQKIVLDSYWGIQILNCAILDITFLATRNISRKLELRKLY